MRKYITKLTICSAFFLATFFFIDYLAGFLPYGGRTSWDYHRPQNPPCNLWHLKTTFADLRNPIPENSVIKVPSCQEARRTTVIETFVTTQENLKIRYVEFPKQAQLDEDTPIWLHIHGITDSWLHGVRYLGAAQRMGFRMVVMELQNHGKSERHPYGSSFGCREKWDILAVLKDMRFRYPSSPILITATSMGTISATLAAFEDPESFESVKAMVYESPVATFRHLERFINTKYSLPPQLTSTFMKLTLELSFLKSKTNFKTCFPKETEENRIVQTPTLLQVSMQEYPQPEFLDFFRSFPLHKSIAIKKFDRGSHSAYWNYQPEEFENSIGQFWSK